MTATSLRWLRRLAGLVALAGGLWAVLAYFGWDPDPLRLSLTVGLVYLAVLLVLDSLADPTPEWWVEGRTLVTPLGGDPRLTSYSRILEDHLSAADPSDALRARLAALAWQRLAQHRALEPDDPRAEAMLGPELAAALRDPRHRFRLAELERHLDTLESL